MKSKQLSQTIFAAIFSVLLGYSAQNPLWAQADSPAGHYTLQGLREDWVGSRSLELRRCTSA